MILLCGLVGDKNLSDSCLSHASKFLPDIIFQNTSLTHLEVFSFKTNLIYFYQSPKPHSNSQNELRHSIQYKDIQLH